MTHHAGYSVGVLRMCPENRPNPRGVHTHACRLHVLAFFVNVLAGVEFVNHNSKATKRIYQHLVLPLPQSYMMQRF